MRMLRSSCKADQYEHIVRLSAPKRRSSSSQEMRYWGGGSHAFGNVHLIHLTKRSQIISKRLGRAMSKFNPSRVGSQYFDICYFSSSQGGERTDCQDNGPHCPKTVPQGKACRLPRKSFYKSEITTRPVYLRSGFTGYRLDHHTDLSDAVFVVRWNHGGLAASSNSQVVLRSIPRWCDVMLLLS